MFHLNTEVLIDYWRSRRGERALPARSDIDPSGFSRLAPRVFLAERRAGGDYAFRLAGEELQELMGRPLKGESLVSLWRPEHRPHLIAALAAARRDGAPLVIGAVAAGSKPQLEILFAPLTAADGSPDLLLGHCQRLETPAPGRLAPLAIARLAGVPVEPVATGPRLAALDGRRIA